MTEQTKKAHASDASEAYSNSGFWLLGLVIEKASGMSYEDYVEKKIFEPLGMTRSMYCNSAEKVPSRAYGYGMVTKPATLNDGTALRYGMGLSVGKDSRASLRAKVGSR